MAKLAYDIILKPVITEKSMEMLTQGKYTFKVAKDSNKIEIAKAVEALFPGVKVAKVNTVNCRGVMKRMGRNEGYTPAWKKAPLKSPFTKAWVFFKKPSVLSELERSAEATIMFSTWVASTPNTVAEAARVAWFAFCSIAAQSILGALPENHCSILAAKSG